jgi:hypothetical protein
VLLGAPEIDRLARGESVTIRLKPNTDELEIVASMLGKARLNPPVDTTADWLKKTIDGFGK